MGSQKLKRKALRNRVKAKVRIQNIKDLQAKPILKNVDIEALKEEFKKKPVKKAESVKAEVAEVKVEKVVEASIEKVEEKQGFPQPFQLLL